MHLTLFDTPVLIVWSLYKATTSRALTLVSVGHIPHNTVFWFSSHLWLNWENSLIYSDLQCIPPTVWIQNSHLIFSIHLFAVWNAGQLKHTCLILSLDFCFRAFWHIPDQPLLSSSTLSSRVFPRIQRGIRAITTHLNQVILYHDSSILHTPWLWMVRPGGTVQTCRWSLLSHMERGKKEGKERKAPPLCNKLQLRASAAGRESALEK